MLIKTKYEIGDTVYFRETNAFESKIIKGEISSIWVDSQSTIKYDVSAEDAKYSMYERAEAELYPTEKDAASDNFSTHMQELMKCLELINKSNPCEAINDVSRSNVFSQADKLADQLNLKLKLSIVFKG